jgi:predicted nucleotide-binding protein
VASFHNGSPSVNFPAEAEDIAKAYVAVLGLALAASNQRFFGRRLGERRVFIGCATEDLPSSQKIQNPLRKSALVRIWNQGAFQAGGYVLETLLRRVKEHDCAILLLTNNDVIEHRGNRYLAPRDNVLFEAGLFFSQQEPF